MAPRPNSIALWPVRDPKAFDVADVVTGREHVAMLGRGGMAIRHAEPEKKKSPEESSSPELLPVGLTGFEPATSTPPELLRDSAKSCMSLFIVANVSGSSSQTTC